ncbi:hypothetical protein JOF53_003397 [Crossiella equi]|uniref:Uncharacterized protein n=1 Tax=Crossiella equi TaxID=130796 RepID=A0ABS5AD73_9PSEU|nr:hypothetical protein [Crossiella equi]MBP2474525.1 hypothetical protein [Crossiella equi]
MFDFGIPGYRPHWLSGAREIRAELGERLAALHGRVLHHVWLLWDTEDGSWWSDAPVLLDFGADQVEINHWKFDEVSVTWNAADRSLPNTWLPEEPGRLEWRADPLPELAALAGGTVHEVRLLVWRNDKQRRGADLDHGSVAFQFVLDGGAFAVENAMDENGLLFGEPPREYRPV